ncbi:NifB/NifX family molybdenum-iron cluster-binding protein [Candidatus Bipolaricaulota bacterium]|nr:NifB/NifX family molybdenum-iron cluster-binding protein [Candidatus Bipolaricaulota bacterium]
MTRVCVPTAGPGGLEDAVGEHFGRVPTYTIFDSGTRKVEIVGNTSEHAGGSGLPADILSKLNINVLLCRGAGRRALDIFGNNGIEVCIGVDGTAGEAIYAWKAGTLSSASNADACQQHAFHDHTKDET